MTDVQQQGIVSATGRYHRTATFDGHSVTIKRGRSTKVLPVSAISGVELKAAGFGTWGFIKFSVAGGNDGRVKLGKRNREVHNNENAVTFGRKVQADFEALQRAVLSAL